MSKHTILCVLSALAAVVAAGAEPDWSAVSPESEGMSATRLERLRERLARQGTKALLVLRHDRLVCEWYAPDHTPNQPHSTASLAKALVGGLATAVVLTDGVLKLDEPAAKYVPPWQQDSRKSRITIRQLGSHTSGLEDAEAEHLPHEQLPGWKGEFWKRQPPPRDPFTLARDTTPVIAEPGAEFHYSNPGMAMLAYAVTAALRDAEEPPRNLKVAATAPDRDANPPPRSLKAAATRPLRDVRTLLRERVLRPLGVPDEAWSVGYGQTFNVDGLPLVASWGGGAFTVRATARVGQLLLHRGRWQDRALLTEEAVRLTTSDAGTPHHGAIGWWSNHEGACEALPRDAFWGAGAGHQVLLVVPSLSLIVVRNGGTLGPPADFDQALYTHLFQPLMATLTDLQSPASSSGPPPATRAVNPPASRLRLLIETDAGGDPDDEQSLVRFLLYANEWEVEGIIANRPQARPGENRNSERTGLGIVRRLLEAYGQCHSNLVQHDPRYPPKDHLWARTMPGYLDTEAAVDLILQTVDRPDPRPLWYSDWGTDRGAATNNLRRALDRVWRERGPDGYAAFKRKLRLASYDQFGPHTAVLAPPFPLWVNTFQPELENRRWYHRFSALTATAGGFDLMRDVLENHGPLGALYPTNTTHWQKEGDTMTFLYLIPTGMNDPEQPTWGSWAGRYGLNERWPGKAYYWANQADTWRGSTHRDNTLARWAAALQADFRARLDWCVKPYAAANHRPQAVLAAQSKPHAEGAPPGAARRSRPAKPSAGNIVFLEAAAGDEVTLSAADSVDPDGHKLSFEWFPYPEAGTYQGEITLGAATEPQTRFLVPAEAATKTIHLLVAVTDDGSPPLTSYCRAVISVH